MKTFLIEFAQNPTECLKKVVENKKTSYAYWGYALSVASIYFACKLTFQNGASLSGFFFIFLVWFIFNILFNFILAAITSLFLEITGNKSNALGLFTLLGISQLIWTLLLPWCLIIKTTNHFDYLTPLFVIILLVLQIAFVLSAMKQVYQTGKSNSLIAILFSLLMPIISIFCLIIFAISTSISLFS